MYANRIAAAALALSVALTACAPTPAAVPSQPSSVQTMASAPAPAGDTPGPGTLPSVATSVSPAPAPATSPATTTSPMSTAKSSAGAPAPDPTRRVVVSGTVYDSNGATLNGAIVEARSMDASVPYSASAATVAGSYVFNNVPEGANLEFTASRSGWTSRARVGSFQRNEQRNAMDFGAPGNMPNATGAAFFLSKYPEIVRVEPANDARDVDPTHLVYKFVLSEPLPMESRGRFEQAIRVLPANDAANGDQAGTTTALEPLEDDAFPYVQTVDGNATVAPYAVASGITFLGDSLSRARVTWNAEGTEATLRFAAPLVTADNDQAAYQVVLVSGGVDKAIEDRDGHQLGTAANGRQANYPPDGELILSAFKARDLRTADVPGLTNNSSEERWAATHDNVVAFEVRRDEVEPKLMAVGVTTVGGETRVELTFSEPMAAFDGTVTGLRHAELGDDAGDLANYTFMIGESLGDLARRQLDNDGPIDVDPRVIADFGGVDAEIEEEFRFAAGAFVADRVGAPTGSVLVEVEASDPRVVRLTVLGRPDFFSNDAIKARVEAVGDPAGNGIREAQGDANQPVGRI